MSYHLGLIYKELWRKQLQEKENQLKDNKKSREIPDSNKIQPDTEDHSSSANDSKED